VHAESERKVAADELARAAKEAYKHTETTQEIERQDRLKSQEADALAAQARAE